MAGLIASVIIAVANPVAVQRPADVVRWSAAAANSTARPGQAVTITVTADIESGWHVYALTQPPGGPRALEVRVSAGSPFAVLQSKIDAPPPRIEHDRNFDLETQFYDEKTTIRVPVLVGPKALAGRQTIPIEIAFQACSDRICLAPATNILRVDVMIGAPARKARS